MFRTFAHFKTKLALKNKSPLNDNFLLFLRAVSIRHSLDGISVLTKIHDGHSGDLPDSPLEVLVTGGHDVRLVLGHAAHQAVVSIGSL